MKELGACCFTPVTPLKVQGLGAQVEGTLGKGLKDATVRLPSEPSWTLLPAKGGAMEGQAEAGAAPGF